MEVIDTVSEKSVGLFGGLDGGDRIKPVDITFKDVTYTTWQWSLKDFNRVPKQILHGVSGVFRGGELSVIMGPSGAGKSTLLNLLAGYVTSGAGGTITVGTKTRECGVTISGPQTGTAYIQQEDAIRTRLTVGESMAFAARLKLGVSDAQGRKKRVEKVLQLLGLEMHTNTMCGKLSGGQKRRLAIALELISNPPVLFLDEPTTGLDSASCGRCVQLLKRLAVEEGRTVVCTLHQPTALMFETFDQVYAVAEGRCIFQGRSKELLPFLANFNLRCPPYHNPADFLIEAAIGDRSDVLKMAEATSGLLTVKNNFKGIEEKVFTFKDTKEAKKRSNKGIQGANQLVQFLILLHRNITIFRRSYKQNFIRVITHIFLALLFGYLYMDVGNNAQTILANYVYLYGTMLLNVYTGKMTVLLNFPLEISILGREHFNRWYRLVPYVFSVLLIELPFQIFCTWLYVTLSYWLTGQDLDPLRFHFFLLFCLLGTICAQSWGYFIGATTPVKIAVFLGPVIAVLFSVFGFCLTLPDTPAYFRWLYHLSYYRAGFHGVVVSVYGLNRTQLPCHEDVLYCHYAIPQKFLKEMGIVNIDLSLNASLMVTITAIMHLLTFGALWLRLNKR